jgi:hypothetical protein
MKKPARAASLLPATAIPMSARLRAGTSFTPTTQHSRERKRMLLIFENKIHEKIIELKRTISCHANNPTSFL